MTPEQIQQLASQQMVDGFAMTPLWMKILMVLQVLSIVVTVICLPLITLKLYFGDKAAKPASLTPEQLRLQQIRERREALEKATAPIVPGSGGVHESANEESRYMPKG